MTHIFEMMWQMCMNRFHFRYLTMSLERVNVDRTFKILFIGDSSVGKTSLMFRYSGMY
jgi:GTPase SAR1 family protein